MDFINKMDQIMIKMKNQMHTKGIISMDQVFIEIARFDPERTGCFHKSKLEFFLSKLGIFLKTQ